MARDVLRGRVENGSSRDGRDPMRRPAFARSAGRVRGGCSRRESAPVTRWQRWPAGQGAGGRSGAGEDDAQVTESGCRDSNRGRRWYTARRRGPVRERAGSRGWWAWKSLGLGGHLGRQPTLARHTACRAWCSPGAPRRGAGLPSSKPGLDAGTHDLVRSRLAARRGATNTPGSAGREWVGPVVLRGRDSRPGAGRLDGPAAPLGPRVVRVPRCERL